LVANRVGVVVEYKKVAGLKKKIVWLTSGFFRSEGTVSY